MQTADQVYSVYRDDALHLINTQIGTANYLLRPEPPRLRTKDASAASNQEIWERIISPEGGVHAGVNLRLEGFYLLEWFPRAPGLYFTDDGRQAREIARHFLRRVPVPRNSATYRPSDIGQKDREFLDIYDPYGKVSMLKGGVGCIRLRPKLLDGGTGWFLSASSTGVAHEGFPVALPDHLFQRYADSIKRTGALRCSLRGKLQFLPDPVVELYRESRGVPQLYLLVDQLIPESDQRHDGLLVSAGISFLSGFEGANRMYASYATFDASVKGSVEEVAEWLEEIYVKGLYSGRVVTDFDEQMTHFAGATFSLRNVMSNQLNPSEVQNVVQTLNLPAADISRMFTGLTMIGTVHIERVERMEQNKSITFGDHATVGGSVFIDGEIHEASKLLESRQAGPEFEQLKALLTQLVNAVAEVRQAVPSAAAENASRDLRNLVEEATAKEPRPNEGARLGERIKNWATMIGETGKPVVELIAAILPLLPH